MAVVEKTRTHCLGNYAAQGDASQEACKACVPKAWRLCGSRMVLQECQIDRLAMASDAVAERKAMALASKLT